jgi:hypothetical protein
LFVKAVYSPSLLISYLPSQHSSLVQIKSHAQKVLKREDEGDNIFRRLEENSDRTEQLVNEAHARMGGEPPSLAASPPSRRYAGSGTKRSQAVVSSSPPSPSMGPGGGTGAHPPKIMVEVSIQTDPYDPTADDGTFGLSSIGQHQHHHNNTMNVSVESAQGIPIIAQVPMTLPAEENLGLSDVADPLPPATVDDMAGGGANSAAKPPPKGKGGHDEAAAVATALTTLNK